MARRSRPSACANQPTLAPRASRHRLLIATATAGLVALGLTAGLAAWWCAAPPSPSSPAAATYVGGQACAGCHREQHERWKASDHVLAMQPAAATTVLGNFQVDLSPGDAHARRLLETMEAAP